MRCGKRVRSRAICASGACCGCGCASGVQQERDPGVNNAGLCAGDAGRRRGCHRPVPCPLSQPMPGLRARPPTPTAPIGSTRADRVRVIVFGQDNLSRVYGIDSNGSIDTAGRPAPRPRSDPLPALAGHRRRAQVQIYANILRTRKSASRSRPIGPFSSWAKSTSRAAIPMSTG